MVRLSPTAAGPEKPLSAESLKGDLIQPDHPLFGIVWINPERMSGAPCFAGTRVPIKNLFDYLDQGESLATFLGDFEGVTRAQAEAIITSARNRLLEQLPRP